MKILALNHRGLNSADSPTISFLGWLVRKFSPQILFLSETKSNVSMVNKLAMYLCFSNVSIANIVNNAG